MNEELKNIYDNVYSGGEDNFFTFSTKDITERIIKELDFTGMRVLEIGCGTGYTADRIAESGAALVSAYDFSKNAIRIASESYKRKNLQFAVGSFEDIKGEFDCIIMQEVIEHTDYPDKILIKLSSYLSRGGHLIITCPSFLNMRGYVWMTLQLLFNVPMSLTDKHFISPGDMERWAKDTGLSLSWFTFRHEQAYGEKMIFDMKKRLTNALRDAKMDNTNVDKLLEWLSAASHYEIESVINGAKALYHFIKN